MSRMFRVVPNKQHEREKEIANRLRLSKVDVVFLESQFFVLRERTKFTAEPSKCFINRLCFAGVTNPPSCPPGPVPSNTKRAFITCTLVASSRSNCRNSFVNSSSSPRNNFKVEFMCMGGG